MMSIAKNDYKAKIGPHSISKQRYLLIQWGYSCCIFASHPSKRGWAARCKDESKPKQKQQGFPIFLWPLSKWSLITNKQKLLHIWIFSDCKRHEHKKGNKKQGLRLCILASYMSKSGVSTVLIFARHSCMRALVYIAIKLVLFRAANLDWYLELFFENIQMSDIWEMEVKGMGSLNINPRDKKRHRTK